LASLIEIDELNHTLKVSPPIGKTLILASIMLSLLFGSGEVLIRQPFLQSFLTTPTLNTRHLHFEKQWNRLELLTSAGVEIQCIALGNSMVLNGFDPQIFDEVFFSKSGESITCFNFGVDALTPVSAAALARILIDTYKPRLLIFGTDARDFAIPPDSEETKVIADTDWIRYRLGNFSLEGWLIDHSYLYRYRYSLARLLALSINRGEIPVTNQYGFEPYDTIFPVDIPPDPNDGSYAIQYYYRILGNYSVRFENREALQNILTNQGSGTTIVVVEMPVPEMYFHFFDDPSVDYARFIEVLRSVTADYHALLLETTSLDLIPNDGWMDYSHVNRKGAMIFSTWLGEQLGQQFSDEKLPIAQPSPAGEKNP
jgi:hypothetical protein